MTRDEFMNLKAGDTVKFITGGTAVVEKVTPQGFATYIKYENFSTYYEYSDQNNGKYTFGENSPLEIAEIIPKLEPKRVEWYVNAYENNLENGFLNMEVARSKKYDAYYNNYLALFKISYNLDAENPNPKIEVVR